MIWLNSLSPCFKGQTKKLLCTPLLPKYQTIKSKYNYFWGDKKNHHTGMQTTSCAANYAKVQRWKADNEDIKRVFSHLRCLTHFIKSITENVVPKASIEERVHNHVKSLLRDCTKGEQINLQILVLGMIVCLDLLDFVHPLHVD